MTVSPMIDHIFTTLDDDIDQKENNFQIFGEISLHVIIITIVWYYINLYARDYLEKVFDLKVKVATKTAINVVSSIALIGLQKNLIEKLEYVTIEHPFRMTDLYD
jgi:hypothetical protein|tara:strand:+ start:1729 stop:2043 length:315 start_codon:yes stop_codon:yes gene_type:complete